MLQTYDFLAFYLELPENFLIFYNKNLVPAEDNSDVIVTQF